MLSMDKMNEFNVEWMDKSVVIKWYHEQMKCQKKTEKKTKNKKFPELSTYFGHIASCSMFQTLNGHENIVQLIWMDDNG